MYMITKNSDELYHYGVLGMRWGVRRYQNYDGTRIGTGGQPVVNRAKTAEGTVKKLKSTMDKGFRNTVPGGQGGKATGNARFAAAAGGNSSNKSEDKKSTAEIILEPSVKKGKDKANTSIAQETAKGLIRTGKATQDSINVIKNSDPKVKKAQEDNATKARKMSDQELRESINRIKMEREYVSLKNDEITTGYDKVIGIIDKAKPFLEVTAEVAGLIASILLIKSKLGHSDSDMELDNLYTYCIENSFPSDVIEHATSLDLDYILDYYNVSAEDLQHMLTDDELYHYGVLGMKWGVRRYQNYDGTRIGDGKNPVIDQVKKAGSALSTSRQMNAIIIRPSTSSKTSVKKNRHQRAADAIQKDIDDLKSRKNIPHVSEQERKDSIKALEAVRDKNLEKSNKSNSVRDVLLDPSRLAASANTAKKTTIEKDSDIKSRYAESRKASEELDALGKKLGKEMYDIEVKQNFKFYDNHPRARNEAKEFYDLEGLDEARRRRPDLADKERKFFEDFEDLTKNVKVEDIDSDAMDYYFDYLWDRY